MHIFGSPLIVLPKGAFCLQKSKNFFSKHALCGYFLLYWLFQL